MNELLERTPWVTPTTAAKASGRSVSTIHTWVRNGDVNTLRYQGRILIYWPDLHTLTFTKPRRTRI